ncbi:MAG: tRNA (adenosine(37)-N6)-threonylcarbamoyltransferase complex ATPase subunit type 1 TsaE [Rhodobacteraceae bacterium]|nr:tRNA (adenosine(37)-N6)-threonylcarbamoyltransferase complex ATPase subunit type 1 TsaE [Paracoccaceae bacterium]
MNYDFTLDSASQTADLASRIGPHLRAGDVLLLSGDIGAGKTHFARSLIQALQAPLDLLEDIPSPTFTLVQTYPLDDVEIWHADLYRIGSFDEIVELGLNDAFATGICLVEWPDRLGADTPKRHLALAFHQGNSDHGRTLKITTAGQGWEWLENV